MNLIDRLGLEYPLVQAGMGGGVSNAELAGAASAAGALGTVGIMAPRAFATALTEAHRRAPGRPVAVNLLAPFTRRDHVRAAIELDAALVVFHGGLPRRWLAELRAAQLPVFATVGTAAAARAAVATGVDGVVVQGIEAGGHLVGVMSTSSALSQVLREVGDAVPVLVAGGVADAADVRRLLELGATAVVAGTRFLLTEESAAHPAYKARVLAARHTLVTELFGVGWPLPHRVIPNALTERWCTTDELGPGWVRTVHRLSAGLGRRLPLTALEPLAGVQRVAVPFYSPALPLVGMPESSVDRAALYAGESARRISGIVSAAQAVALLAG